MKKFNKTFNKKKPVIGMIHVDPLPGSPLYRGDLKKIIQKSILEAMIYIENDIDSIAIENMHDVPYLKRAVGPEVTSTMSIIAYEIKNKTDLPVGIQILAGANKEALAAANSAGIDFIRAEGFIYGHMADEGFMESDAGELLRYRKAINAENVLIFTDIKKKHSSHSITEDITLIETARTAEFFLSDGLIITGTSTGAQTETEEIKSVKKNTNLHVLVGSGITEQNIENYFPISDGFIVGSYFKKNGNWKNTVDKKRVKSLMKKINELRMVH